MADDNSDGTIEKADQAETSVAKTNAAHKRKAENAPINHALPPKMGKSEV